MASFATQTGQTIDEAFAEFDAENPHIYELFKKYLREWWKANKGNPGAKTSSKLIINRIRWEVETTTTAKDFKINDAFTQAYSRKFVAENPDFKHLFEFRERRSA
jgi:hypothetical protein